MADMSATERTDAASLLAEEHQRASAQVDHLTATIDAVIESSEQIPADDEHDPDGATIAFERAQVAALLRDARARLDDLDRARERLREGTYGVCEDCRQPIAAERLTARPTATACVRCAATVMAAPINWTKAGL